MAIWTPGGGGGLEVEKVLGYASGAGDKYQHMIAYPSDELGSVTVGGNAKLNPVPCKVSNTDVISLVIFR